MIFDFVLPPARDHQNRPQKYGQRTQKTGSASPSPTLWSAGRPSSTDGGARLPAEERIGWIRQDRWINYTRTEQILTCLAGLLDYPPRDRMPSLLLFGATGMARRVWSRSSCVTNPPHSTKSPY